MVEMLSHWRWRVSRTFGIVADASRPLFNVDTAR
jgi:hypothetical protein